jgi:DNA (cytosine-5)-methyltransferase 1
MGLRTLDLFCGGGGSSWGARNAGAEIVCGVDACPLAAKTFQTNFPDARVINISLNEKSSVSVLEDVEDIDLVLASPECTNHTCARGSRPRDEDSKRTARYVINFAHALNPRWIIIENVVHMRSWDGYSRLVTDIEDLGYHVRPEVLDSVEFGVPQTRRRLFLLCDREAVPSPVMRPSTGHACMPKAKDVIRFDGSWKSGLLYKDRRAPDTLARAERAFKALGRGKPFLIVYYGTDGSGGWQTLDRPLRTLTTLDRFGLVTWSGDTPMLRMLQVPELQRAMGFDDHYELSHGSRRDRIRLLGNGVCPPVMEAVVRSLTQIKILQAAE